MLTINPSRAVTSRLDVQGVVLCDAGRIQQLLSNLLANALTHGATDAPVVVDASVDGTQLMLSVTNEGEPIAPHMLVKVFEPYWRPPTSAPGGGLGLGLYICKQIVEAHAGRLEVTSGAHTGTRFTAYIPLA